MAILNSAAFETPFTSETLIRVRTGKIKSIPGTEIKSAINKTIRQGRVFISKHGVQDDEQEFERHGGPDKAVMQYCRRHYADRAAELPQSAPFFKEGGFGENFVGVVANERNICIGDVVAVGDNNVLLQVSLPRAPCYKLNHRFQHENMSRLSQESSRMGWYYRVLREGFVQQGDAMRLVERPNPKWTVFAVQQYMHREKSNQEAMRELVALKELGEEARNLFANRLAKKMESEEHRLKGGAEDALETWAEYSVVIKRKETSRIMSFVFEAVDSARSEQDVLPGSHVRVKLGNLIRSYSIVAGSPSRLELGVALEESSRGGSTYLHDNVEEGDSLTIGKVTESFPFETSAAKHVMIAGGIGITAFIAAAQKLKDQSTPWELHLCVRSAADVPFRRYLDPLGANLKIYSKADSQRLDIGKLLGAQTSETHIYCCGPERLMQAVTDTAKMLSFPSSNLHFEAFTTTLTGDPFEVGLKRSGKCLSVPSSEVLLDVLRDAGLDVPSSCEAGNCGTCKVRVVAGRVEHRGTALSENEKKGEMLSCVSRGVGRIELDL
ncbi:uncharacterized protein K452DRAFT_290792 [Aplosporella prunicola CBS 121167]|uniref:MOSC domain-containing protein n=1 Tax=Aplosporella prunicola CBS 121167 TaxID=1176127 RepID=A0A6A6B5F0_9PEZI|nr:uncharacterized protein K452DRAFT_290792 [Aplosporella prunicola CBS 121167]KAF2138207.1 hypothetical protein K452DRAFT_290792 [Aplosporella prunicola CBS 121167]